MYPLLLILRSAGDAARPPLEGRGLGLTVTLPLPLLLLRMELERDEGGGISSLLSGCTVVGEGAGGRIGLGGAAEGVSDGPLCTDVRLGAE